MNVCIHKCHDKSIILSRAVPRILCHKKMTSPSAANQAILTSTNRNCEVYVLNEQTVVNSQLIMLLQSISEYLRDPSSF